MTQTTLTQNRTTVPPTTTTQTTTDRTTITQTNHRALVLQPAAVEGLCWAFVSQMLTVVTFSFFLRLFVGFRRSYQVWSGVGRFFGWLVWTVTLPMAQLVAREALG